MKYLSFTSMSGNLAELLEIVKQEPVIISQAQTEVAIMLSIKEYEKILSSNIEDFQSFCNRVGTTAQAKGLTEEILLEILSSSDG
jgi:prevent-host-death family protein